MIVRIMADNQYRVDDAHAAAITKLDDELNEAVEANDQARFTATLSQLITHVQQIGQVILPEEVIPSDLMIPAPDMSLAEAHDALQRAAAHEQPS